MKLKASRCASCLQAAPDDAVCGICAEVLEGAVRTGCGHWFCRDCVLGQAEDEAAAAPCPTCSKPMVRSF